MSWTKTQLFVAEDPKVRWDKWLDLMEQLEQELQPLQAKWGCKVVLMPGDAETSKSTPAVRVFLPEARLGLTAMQAVKALQDGDAAGGVQIAPNPPFIEEGAIGFGPLCLKEGEPEIVAKAVLGIVESAAERAGVAAEVAAGASASV
eukprot:SAG22_NODE_935_length_6425_cov_10.116819_6_plen_147_part_00